MPSVWGGQSGARRRLPPRAPGQLGAADGLDLVGVDLGPAGRGPDRPPAPAPASASGKRARPRRTRRRTPPRPCSGRPGGHHLLASPGGCTRPGRPCTPPGPAWAPMIGGCHAPPAGAPPRGGGWHRQLLRAPCCQGQAVAALGLAGGHAQAEHLLQGPAGLLRPAPPRVACRVALDGGEDAAARGQDIQIGHARGSFRPNSCSRQPPKTRWVWASTRPGVTRRPCLRPNVAGPAWSSRPHGTWPLPRVRDRPPPRRPPRYLPRSVASIPPLVAGLAGSGFRAPSGGGQKADVGNDVQMVAILMPSTDFSDHLHHPPPCRAR